MASAKRSRGNSDGAALGRAVRHDTGHQQLDLGEDVLLGGEGHLQVDLVELPGAAVRPGRLIPKAGSDLEVALDAADHEQLLELLGRLGQGVELARIEAAGHQEVPGALRRRGGEHRGLHLKETAPGHVVAYHPRQPVAGGQSLQQRAATQVEVAVAQAAFLADFRLLLHRERQDLRGGQHLHVVDDHFHGAGLQLGVDGLGRPGRHLARDADHALDPQVRQHLEGGPAGMSDELHQAAGRQAPRLSQVDEQQPAVVPLGRHPPGQTHPPAGVLEAERPAPGLPVAVDGEGRRVRHDEAAGYPAPARRLDGGGIRCARLGVAQRCPGGIAPWRATATTAATASGPAPS